MRRRQFLLGAAAVLGAATVCTPVLLIPGRRAPSSPPPAPIDAAEHARTIEAMRPPKRARPIIALYACNAATEITDLLVPFGVLARAGVADVMVVAEQATPVSLFPFSKFGRGPELLKVEPQATIRDFDQRHPDGADYVLVPAIDPRDDPSALNWIAAQRTKGATIVSVCAGALTLGAAGLLDGRQATTHWAYVDELREARPSMQWQANRRYVATDGVATSTGITASLPVSIALVEAIAGRERAAALARELGVANWDARHNSTAFVLTTEHRKTFLRNWVSFWRKETLGFELTPGVDEVTLALTIDAYSRTALSDVVTIGSTGAPVRSSHGLLLYPRAAGEGARVDGMIGLGPGVPPGRSIDVALQQIASRFDQATADIAALQMEYPV